MGLKQSMKQTMGMTMTPQLQQAIKILQMSVIELQQEVSSALVENPTLEEVSPDEVPEREERSLEEAKDRDPNAEGAGAPDAGDSEFQNVLDSSFGNTPWKSTRNYNSDELPTYEQIVSKPQTLQDHLIWQLRMSTEDEKTLLIGEEIIGNINEDGYLVILLEELAQNLKVSKEEVEAVLYRIQRFDPPGVAARNLQECLMIQAEALNEDDEVEEIIEKHLSELETKNYMSISKSLGIPLNRTIELCKVIHGMEPKPGRAFNNTEPLYFVPDIYVVNLGGDYIVVLNEDGIPRLKVSKEYQTQVSGGGLDPESKAYLKEKLKGANWLLKSIYQRQKTIYRVTQAILRKQKDFFDKGAEYLKPMILKDVADELELHESTISRVTTNKYVHTPHGIFELKYFFNSGLAMSDGTADVASEAVRIRLKTLIQGEDAKNPLSDQQLAEMLGEAQIKVARRTVAKYREALGILPSNKRKKYF